MLWFSVWAVLVLGTLVGAFFLLRSVYRSGRVLLDEIERATNTLALLTDRVEELSAAGADATPAPPDLLDPEPARARLTDARARRLLRRARRSDRNALVFRRWEAFTR
jgi:hypothetical protein